MARSKPLQQEVIGTGKGFHGEMTLLGVSFTASVKRPCAPESLAVAGCACAQQRSGGYLWIGADPVESLAVADAPFARSRRQMPSVRALLA